MSNLTVHTKPPKKDTSTTIGKVFGNVLVVLVGVLTCAVVVSLGVLALVSIWRHIVGA